MRAWACWVTAHGEQRLVPTQVAGAAGWAEVHTGWFHTCGRKTDGTAWCWGYNFAGQLGNDDTTSQLVPVLVAGSASWLALTVGQYHTCGIAPMRPHGVGGTTTHASSATARQTTSPARYRWRAPTRGRPWRPASHTPAVSVPTAPCGAGATTAWGSSQPTLAHGVPCRFTSVTSPPGCRSFPGTTPPWRYAGTRPHGVGARHSGRRKAGRSWIPNDSDRPPTSRRPTAENPAVGCDASSMPTVLSPALHTTFTPSRGDTTHVSARARAEVRTVGGHHI